MIKLCIFDLDGTLIDSAPDLMASANYALKYYGQPTRTLVQIQASMGNGLKRLLTSSILPEEYTDQLFNGVKDMYVKHYRLHCTDNTIVYDGVHDTLYAMQQQGIMLAVVTNKPSMFLDKILADLFRDIEFQYMIGQGEYPVKPDPSSIFAILDKSGFGRDQCVYVGDTEVDMQTGINAGIRTVAVSWGYRSVQNLKEAGADYIIDNIMELMDIVI